MKLGAMKLAVNYSPAAAALLDRGAVDFDLFKCPPWPEVIAAAGELRPVFVHLEAHAGQGRPGTGDLDGVAEMVRATSTPFVNTHLAPLRRDLDAGLGSEPDADSAESRRARARRRVLADVDVLVARFGAGRVAVENVPWERRPDYPIDRVAATPELMGEVLRASGAHLLLDLAHARLAAEELGCDPETLVAPLPTDRLAELHVTGLGYDAGGRRRDHMPMTGDDWRLLEWALGEIAGGRWRRPWAVVLEYGGVGPLFEWRSDRAVLARQLPRLASLLAAAGLR
jgi:uncharacterized protein (UPF0276 family)